MGGWTIVTTSPRQSQNLGRNLGKLVQGGEIIGLVGEFGAGKTCFVRGFAHGINVGAEAWVRSPTFTLINEYSGRLPVYHIDLYRLKDEEEAIRAGVEDCIYSDHICFVEWPEKAPGLFPNDTVHVFIEVEDSETRHLTIQDK